MHREYHRWYSCRLDRDMELLVFGHAGAKVLVFPTRDGNFWEYERMRVTEWLRPKLDAGELQLFCVENISHESYYNFWAHPAGRIYRHYQYEEYLLNEVLPFMSEKNSDPCTIAHGCSLGAFFAASIAFRYPQYFQKLVALSGRYDLTLAKENFSDLLGGHYDEGVYHLMPSHFLPRLDCENKLKNLRAMDIVFAIGQDDPYLDNNHELSEVLWNKGIWHQMHTWDSRAHSPYYWRRMAPMYL